MNAENSSVNAVVFDMDGVLIDSGAVIERAWTEAAQLFDRKISDEDIRQHIHGQPGPHTIKALFSDLPISAQEKIQAHVIYVENTAEYNPISGIKELIHALHESDVTLAIVTSGWQEKIDRVIDLLEANYYFSVIVQRDDVSKGKPFPDPYLLAAKRLNLPASDMIVFEDAHSGVKSAVTAGAYCVGIGDKALVDSGAQFVIPNFTQVSVQKGAESHLTCLRFPEHQLMVSKKTINMELE